MKAIPVCAFVCLLAGQAASADTLRVPDDFASIQAAIDAAADGDTILVSPGVYSERINLLGKAIEVASTEGAAATTIDGSVAPGSVVIFGSNEGQGTVVSGFTITGGTNSGVRLHGASPVLRDLVITGNGSAASNGGGIAIFGGAPTLRDLVIDGNDANQFGGGLYAAHATLDAERLTITNNGTVTPRGLNSFIYETIGGGGFYTTDTGGRIVSSVIRGNASAFGGGAYIAGGRTLELVNSLVAENSNGTGAVYANASSPRLVGCTVSRNDTFALFTTFNADPKVENSILAGNGTAVYSTEIGGNGRVTVRSSVLEGGVFTDVVLEEGVINSPAQLDAEYRPLPGSPAIDAGNNGLVPQGVVTDVAGNPRFVDDPGTPDTGVGEAPIVDLGAFEFVPAAPVCVGDMDGDRTLDLRDVQLFVAAFTMGMPDADLNADSVLDLRDVMMFATRMESGCDG